MTSRSGNFQLALAAFCLAGIVSIWTAVNPPAAAAAGPDAFGYTSITSTDPGGPAFDFINIATPVTQVAFVDPDALPAENPNADDGVARNIPLTDLNAGAGFPFYGEFLPTVQMSTNGFLTFILDSAADSLSNTCPFPEPNDPNKLIAVLWDDLVLRNPPSLIAGGYQRSFLTCPNTQGGTGACVIFQWDNVDHFGGSVDSFDFQAILYDSGNILMNYGPGNPEHGSGSTTGLKNTDGSIGFSHVCNLNASIPDNFSILFRHPQPQLNLVKTVAVCVPDTVPGALDPTCAEQCGTASNITVEPGTAVRYCYNITNSGTFAVNRHTLVDDHLGTLLENFAYTLNPGASAFITQKATITADVTNIATWTSRAGNNSGASVDEATVRVGTDGVGTDGQCIENTSGTDCVYADLKPAACAGVNSFLGQINIASVINLQATQLDITVKFLNSAGAVAGSVTDQLAPNLKKDYIINDMGLSPNSVGSVCVETNASTNGAWTGGISIYKPDFRAGTPNFGEAFDFALSYPFLNPALGSTTVPLNTFHLGTNPAALVANWISIADGIQGDGIGLQGSLRYLDSQGVIQRVDSVNVPDGGRLDFSGHDGLTLGVISDAVGLAQFVPSDNFQRYYLTLTRYFYDCPGASCNNFLTAFNIPRRPGTEAAVAGGVSTVKGEISIVELNNVGSTPASTSLNVFGESGASAGQQPVDVPPLGTRHVIVNRSGVTGFLETEQVGFSSVDATTGALSATSLFYKLNPQGVLEYGYSAPLVGSPGLAQLSQFNSFIQHRNDFEAFNTATATRTVTVNYVDFLGANVFSQSFDLAPNAARRLTSVGVPANSYGTINTTVNDSGVIVRNYVAREGIYTLPFPGE